MVSGFTIIFVALKVYKKLIKSVLITGGSGLVGTALTQMLLQKGYHVSHLARTPASGLVKSYRWSIADNYIDPAALVGVDAIVHLAGAGVADKRWTPARKKEILESRTQSTRLIYNILQKQPNQVSVVVSATAIGYYGLTTADHWCNEQTPAGTDFLASVCQAWEAAADPVQELSKRLVKIRVGVVLSSQGGALAQMAKPVRWGVGAPLGSGQQWISWIHVQDLCALFVRAIENQAMTGVYNGVAPNPVTNRELTKLIAQALHRPLWLPSVPTWALQLMLGEMSQLVITGARVSNEKALRSGMAFTYDNAQKALDDLFAR
jgi:uncharacterized protein